MSRRSPFHEGELFVQQRSGELESALGNGRMLAGAIPPGALAFVAQQPMVVVGSLDSKLYPWASPLVGPPGFVRAIDPTHVKIDLEAAAGNQADPLWENIAHQSQVGLLLIELPTRRRLRINGRIERIEPARLQIQVEESYPNCPKYIQRRRVALGEASSPEPGGVRSGSELPEDLRAFIRSADTFFVASAHPERGVDTSHRGGNPGFVEVIDERTLRIPDYPGNSMFNTLGNFVVHPEAGLLFPDFQHHRTLQLIGKSEILWDQDAATDTTGGTRRYWRFGVEGWLASDLPGLFDWQLLDYSPFNP